MISRLLQDKNYLWCVMVVLASFSMTAHADNLLHNPPPAGWIGRKTLTWLDSKNEVRSVDVYVPESYRKAKDGVPVVMWFMGSRRNVRKDYHYLGMSYEDSGIAPYAEKNNFMLVVIDQKHIDDKGWSMLEGDDRDETLTLDVLAYLKKTFPIDASRVYLWGISAGGKLSQVLAAKHADLFAAVVSFSGVFDDPQAQITKDFADCVKNAARKFPIQHWQTAGDYASLIQYMPDMLKLYRENGHRMEFVWLDNLPGRQLKHEWYADLYNQRMWDWCRQFSVGNEEQEPGHVLGISADGRYFTINNAPAFLLGISYYAAAGISTPQFMRDDTEDMARDGFNWIRVWASWTAGELNFSVLTPEGEVREPYMSRLKSLIELCDRRGIIVDVTITRGARPLPSNLAEHLAFAKTLARELLPYRNVYFDIGNERDIGDARHVGYEEMGQIIGTIKEIDPARICTASGVPSSAKDLEQYLQTGRCDFIAPHLGREADSPAKTAAAAREIIGWMDELGRRVPLHLQEPFRRDYNRFQPEPADYFLDCANGKQAGAAGWCLHNGSNRNSEDGIPWRSFRMTDADGRLYKQLDAVELEVAHQIKTKIGGLSVPGK